MKFLRLIFKHFCHISDRIPGYYQNQITKLLAVDDRLQGDSNDSVVVYFVVDSIKRCHLSVPLGMKGWSPKRSSSPSSDNSERLSPICIIPRYILTFLLAHEYLSHGTESRTVRGAITRRKLRVFVFTFVVIKRDE